MTNSLTHEQIKKRIIDQFGERSFNESDIKMLMSFAQRCLGIEHIDSGTRLKLGRVSDQDTLATVIFKAQNSSLLQTTRETADAPKTQK